MLSPAFARLRRIVFAYFVAAVAGVAAFFAFIGIPTIVFELAAGRAVGGLPGFLVLLLLPSVVISMVAGAVGGVPAIVVGEVLTIRSRWFYMLATPAALLALAVLATLAKPFDRESAFLISGLLAAGMVAGIVYWDIAGRAAGRQNWLSRAP